MLDLSNIPYQQQQTYTFYATGNWLTWNKPRNAKIIEIFCLGAGGGGATGGVSASAAVGGGGGASGGIVRGLIPAFLLPDTFYILVGKGGAGGTTGNGSLGGNSYISLQPSTSEQTLICKSSVTNAGGAVGSTGGSAPTISLIPLSAFGNLGLFTAIAGVSGSNGGANTPTSGFSQNALASSIVTGGAGGGGHRAPTNTVGGNINAASSILTSQVNGGQSIGEKGADGYYSQQPFCSTGGAGGASSYTSNGGNGGNGAYGSGGGGGAGGGFNVVGLYGRGGNGGDGIVIITVIC